MRLRFSGVAWSTKSSGTSPDPPLLVGWDVGCEATTRREIRHDREPAPREVPLSCTDAPPACLFFWDYRFGSAAGRPGGRTRVGRDPDHKGPNHAAVGALALGKAVFLVEEG